MHKMFLLISILVVCILGISCANSSTEVTNTNYVKYINSIRETKPPAPTGSYTEGEEEKLNKRLYFRVESELQKHVDYDVADEKNNRKNVLFLLDHYETMDLDILDVAEYIPIKSEEYNDDDIMDKIRKFWKRNKGISSEIRKQKKIGYGIITPHPETSPPTD